ncbi:MAG TPA: hypothetical protein PLW35_08625, partial [Verrucomicrobiota bacterium]|nr:hypothetical protein [Verrucomicrobiota bacterium]
VGIGRREAFGVRQLAAALSSFPNNVSVPIWPHSIWPLIPMVPNALLPMQWVLAGAKLLDAVGVGRREAFGVRQLAAALFPCRNNVPRIRSA